MRIRSIHPRQAYLSTGKFCRFTFVDGALKYSKDTNVDLTKSRLSDTRIENGILTFTDGGESYRMQIVGSDRMIFLSKESLPIELCRSPNSPASGPILDLVLSSGYESEPKTCEVLDRTLSADQLPSPILPPTARFGEAVDGVSIEGSIVEGRKFLDVFSDESLYAFSRRRTSLWTVLADEQGNKIETREWGVELTLKDGSSGSVGRRMIVLSLCTIINKKLLNHIDDVIVSRYSFLRFGALRHGFFAIPENLVLGDTYACAWQDIFKPVLIVPLCDLAGACTKW